MKTKITLVLLILSLSLNAQEIACDTLITNSKYFNEISEDGLHSTTIINSTFSFDNFLDCILRETIKTKYYGTENPDSEINIRALKKDEMGNYDGLLWEINDRGHEIKHYWRFISLVNHGCCSIGGYNIFYNKLTGCFHSIASSPIYNISASPRTNNPKYVSYLSSNTLYKSQYTELYKNLFGILNFANEVDVEQKLLIFWETNREYGTPEIITNNSLGKKIVTLNYHDFFKIVIPINDYGILAEKIETPDSLSISYKLVNNNPLYLDEERFLDLSVHNKDELRYLRNEIFARHGHSFDNPELKEYFDQKGWYNEISGFKVDDHGLTFRERETINKILELEKN